MLFRVLAVGAPMIPLVFQVATDSAVSPSGNSPAKLQGGEEGVCDVSMLHSVGGVVFLVTVDLVGVERVDGFGR